jgi:hypothetical protein
VSILKNLIYTLLYLKKEADVKWRKRLFKYSTSLEEAAKRDSPVHTVVKPGLKSLDYLLEIQMRKKTLTSELDRNPKNAKIANTDPEPALHAAPKTSIK